MENLWDDISFIARGKRRKKVFKSLTKPMMPIEIARENKLSIANVSITLNELKNRNLVQILTQKAKFGRIYTLSKKGLKISTKIKE